MKQYHKSDLSKRIEFWKSQQLRASLNKRNANSPDEYRFWDEEYGIACKKIQELEMELWNL